MERPSPAKSHESDDWFLTCDFVNRILVIGFDRDVAIQEVDRSRFLTTVTDSCELVGGDFDVVFWCGPSSALPPDSELQGFEDIVAMLSGLGARQFGLMVSKGSEVCATALKARARAMGHELHQGDTVDTLEFSFGIARMNALENPTDRAFG